MLKTMLKVKSHSAKTRTLIAAIVAETPEDYRNLLNNVGFINSLSIEFFVKIQFLVAGIYDS